MSIRPSRSRLAVAAPLLAGLLIAAGLAFGGSTGPPSTPPAAAPVPQEYVGSQACLGCHANQAALLDKTVMGKILLHFPRTQVEKLGCEGCHGPRSRHVSDATNPAYWQSLFGTHGKTASPAKQNAVCLVCHDKGTHLYWRGSVHERRELACVKCHTVHEQVSPTHQLAKPDEFELCGQCHVVRRAQLQRSSHMPLRESKMTCSDCHNPHGSATPKLINANSANDLCYRCHAERRGPFLWEHQPVKENCMTCHEPHGSIHDHLLTREAERLCQACHITNRHPTQGHDPKTRFVFNRSCRNCHPMIHGSNHPSGRFFQR